MVRSSDPRQPPATWTLAKFTNRLCYARDLHHVRDMWPRRFVGTISLSPIDVRCSISLTMDGTWRNYQRTPRKTLSMIRWRTS